MWIMALFRRDFKIAARNLTAIMLPLVYLLVCATLFPLATNADIAFLSRSGTPVILLAVLLASQLSLENIFKDDLENATIDQMLLSSRPLSIIMLVRSFIHWLTTMLPMILIAPIVALTYGLSGNEIKVLLAALFLSTPVLVLVGVLGSAILAGTKQGNILVAIIVLPLYIPIMILAGDVTAKAKIDAPISTHFLLLGALFFLAVSLVPLAASLAIKQATKYE